MYNKSISKNLTANKTVSFITILFIAGAVSFLSLALILAANLSGAIDRLMEKAATPHFMQMHTGELEPARLEAFAKSSRNVADFQIQEFLNIDSSQIVLGSTSLSGSVQDNGFCTQNSRFDFLLDLEDRPILPKDGQLYVPVCYLKDNSVKAGDTAVVNGKTFVVAGFVRDSQMNSALASSKRFVVSQADYNFLEPSGKTEYIIEFRLHDLSKLRGFETAYANAGLPANGPAITWPLFWMISAASDGIMIAVIVMISILVIMIALLSLRFTLLARIEEDYREIPKAAYAEYPPQFRRRLRRSGSPVYGRSGRCAGIFSGSLVYQYNAQALQ